VQIMKAVTEGKVTIKTLFKYFKLFFYYLFGLYIVLTPLIYFLGNGRSALVEGAAVCYQLLVAIVFGFNVFKQNELFFKTGKKISVLLNVLISLFLVVVFCLISIYIGLFIRHLFGLDIF
jgi:magnesium-transporting ATPase (P-type)